MLITILIVEHTEDDRVLRRGHCWHLGWDNSLLNWALLCFAGHLASVAPPANCQLHPPVIGRTRNTSTRVGGRESDSTPSGKRFTPNHDRSKFQG